MLRVLCEDGDGFGDQEPDVEDDEEGKEHGDQHRDPSRYLIRHAQDVPLPIEPINHGEQQVRDRDREEKRHQDRAQVVERGEDDGCRDDRQARSADVLVHYLLGRIERIGAEQPRRPHAFVVIIDLRRLLQLLLKLLPERLEVFNLTPIELHDLLPKRADLSLEGLDRGPSV